MTRTSLRRRMRAITWGLVAVLVVALASKLAEIGLVPLPIDKGADLAKALYEVLKDMAVVIVTIAAAYLAGILQKRSTFTTELTQEWRRIVKTKSELFAFCERDDTTNTDYVRAFCCISEAIDSMRVVYRNVGETDRLVGLYPYVPLHDMRRAFQTLDPTKGAIDPEQRKLVRDAILQSFYAMRETFLEELDLDEPESPQIVAASLRRKMSGATRKAKRLHEAQAGEQKGLERPREDVDRLLANELQRERDKERERAGGR